MALIPLCENNLNLQMRSFFQPSSWLSPLVYQVVMLLPPCAALIFLFAFTEADFVAQL